MDIPPSSNKVIITSFFVDLIDVITSLFITLISGSVVMLAQVLEGLADLASSGFLLIGLVRSKRGSTRKHPFGHGRELYFWTMLSSVLILGVTSTLSIYFGYQRLIDPMPIKNIYFAFGILIITAFTNGYALSLSVRKLLRGKSILRLIQIFIPSPLIEIKTSLVLDLMGTLASIFGFLALVLYQISGSLFFDGIGAIVIGGLLAIFGVLLLVPLRELIIGQSASSEIEDKIREATLTHPEVRKVLGLKTLHIGSEKLLVNAEVNLKRDLNTEEIEGIIARVKQDIKKEVPEVKHIHIELETR